ALRVKIGHSEFGKSRGLIEGEWRPLWVVDFPMFEFDDDAQRWNAVHHPFTSPKDGHEDWLETHPGRCLAKAYDAVLNGIELGGGSVRIPREDVPSRVVAPLEIGAGVAQCKFGLRLAGLPYGAPPPAPCTLEEAHLPRRSSRALVEGCMRLAPGDHLRPPMRSPAPGACGPGQSLSATRG